MADTISAGRFWAKVQRSASCWTWTAGLSPKGYGLFRTGGRGSSRISAHRMAWGLTRGPIPEGQYVCHTCDNPSCVNPAHLFLGTQFDNMRDMVAKGRHGRYNAKKTECVRGHAFTAANTLLSGGSRVCRECKRDDSRARRAAGRVSISP